MKLRTKSGDKVWEIDEAPDEAPDEVLGRKKGKFWTKFETELG